MEGPPMIHVLLGPAEFDDRIPDHTHRLLWRDDLSVGPVPVTNTLAELSRIRESFWRTPTPLRRLHDIDRAEALKAVPTGEARTKAERILAALDASFAERDETIARLDLDGDVVVWYGPNRQESLMLFSLLHFLDPAIVRNGRVLQIRCPKWGPTVYPADELAKFFDLRQVVGIEFLEAARAGWAAYTRPEPTELNAFVCRLREQRDPLACVFDWILEEYPSLHNGLSRLEEDMLRRVGEGESIVRVIANSMGEGADRIGDGMLFERMWRFLEDESSVIELIGRRELASITSPRDFVMSRVRLTDFGRRLFSADADYVSANGLDRWVGGVDLTGKSTQWRYDAEIRQVVRVRT